MITAREHFRFLPEFDNPEQHLTFEQEVIKPLHGSVRGKETIKRTGLNRKLLSDRRFERLKIFNVLALIARNNLPNMQEARELFRQMALPESEYSLMIKSNFPDLVQV